jgi:ABC-2 type transport system permease protein
VDVTTATADDATWVTPTPPGDLRAALLIARRGAVESLRDRSTTLLAVFFALILPILLVVSVVGPMAERDGTAGGALAGYLLLVGLLPSTAAVGSAAGQFAGEKEQGNLTPLLASPASNAAIFGGKVFGAVAPAMLFSLVAEVAFVGSLALIDPGALRRLPVATSIAMLALVPVVAVLAAAVASLVSSRVRTYNAAQQIAGLALTPVWGVVGVLAFAARDWSPWAHFAVVVGLAAVDAALVLLAAATWRREEVLARR